MTDTHTTTTPRGAGDKKREALERISGTFENAKEVNDRLAFARQHAHLISPVTAVSTLPEGVGIALSMEQIDIERDTYGLPGGKRAILKPALERIARAAGVKWDAAQCYVRQVGLHHYQARAVGYVLDLSFQSSPIVGEVDMDYGPGSIGEEKVRADARDKGAAEKTLREIRHFLSRHAESRAYLRAIRRLGVATSYTAEQLSRPFVALQLTWTGRSADRETQRELTRMTAERMLGASAALYGKREERAPEVATPRPVALDATPRLPERVARDTVSDFLDYDEDTGEVREPVRTQAKREPARRDATSAPSRTSSASSEKGGGQPSRSGPVFRFGKLKDQPLSDAGADDLDWYRGKIEEGANDPEKSRFRDDALRHLAEIDRAIAAANGEDAAPPDDESDPRTSGSPDDY